MEHAAFALRLRDATNTRTVGEVVSCFADDYLNQTPAHPGRGFTGKDQVGRNWAQIFAAVPDHTATLIASAQDGDTVWTEWEMGGTRADGSPHRMCGPIIFTVRDGLASAARFYLERVEDLSVDGGGVDADADADAAVRRILS